MLVMACVVGCTFLNMVMVGLIVTVAREI